MEGSSRDKLYDILGWGYSNNRRILRKLTIMRDIHLNKYPLYLDNILNNYKYPDNHRQADLFELKCGPC